MSRWVLGLNLHHDASACLARDGVPVVAVAQERLSRVKHASFVRDELVDYCLDAADIGVGDLDLVVLTSIWLPGFLHDDQDLLWEWYQGLVRRELGTSFRLAELKPPVTTLSHHLAHAYSVFGSSGWDEAAVLVVDWAGSCRMDLSHPQERRFHEAGRLGSERERVSLYHFDGEAVRVVDKEFCFGVEDIYDYRLPLPLFGGIGGMYEVVGQFIFGGTFMAGKVMGLAPYGTPDPVPIGHDDDGLLVPTADLLKSFIGQKVPPDDPLQWADLAATAQATLEQEVSALVGRLQAETGSARLAYGGGVALNCVLNSKLEREGPFEELFILPASNDTGAALGAALYGDSVLGARPGYVHASDYLGRAYGDDEMERALAAEAPLVRWERLDPDGLAPRVAQLLADGNVIGWFQGRSELGPRALGSRSILADARDPGMKDLLNKKVKHREPFRPFGPLVLAERLTEVFDSAGRRPFMLHADDVRDEWKGVIPSAVHVDGSAREQAVYEETNPRLYALLSAFEEITGVPVLINTSLNVRGEPIVERPEDAVDILRRGKLDYLVMGDFLATVAPLRFDDPEVAALVPVWREGLRVTEQAEAVDGGLRLSWRRALMPGRPTMGSQLPNEQVVDDLIDGRRTIAELLDVDSARRSAFESRLREGLAMGLFCLVPGDR